MVTSFNCSLVFSQVQRRGDMAFPVGLGPRSLFRNLEFEALAGESVGERCKKLHRISSPLSGPGGIVIESRHRHETG